MIAEALYYAATGAFANYWRGRGTVGNTEIPAARLLCCLLTGIVDWYFFGIAEALVNNIGLYLILLFGWHPGFSSFHGRAPGRDSGTFAFVDQIVGALYRDDPSTPGQWRKWGTIWMCLRWGIASIPLWAGKVWLHDDWTLLAGIPLTAFVGFLYAVQRYFPEKNVLRRTEPVVGFYVCLLIKLNHLI